MVQESCSSLYRKYEHVSNILSKLRLADRTQAAIYALQQRLVTLKDALDKDI